MFLPCSVFPQKENIETQKPDSLRYHIKYFGIPLKRDSTIRISFYKILDRDTLKLEEIRFRTSLKKNMKFSEVVWRAQVEGTVILEFEIDSSGYGKNVRILSRIGAGVEESLVDAINKSRFEYNGRNYSENYSILLISYFKFWQQIEKTPPIPLRNN